MIYFAKETPPFRILQFLFIFTSVYSRRLFRGTKDVVNKTKAEKLKTLLHYFKRVTIDSKGLHFVQIRIDGVRVELSVSEGVGSSESRTQGNSSKAEYHKWIFRYKVLYF